MIALKSCVPLRAFVRGKWPLAASVLYINSCGHFLHQTVNFDGGECTPSESLY